MREPNGIFVTLLSSLSVEADSSVLLDGRRGSVTLRVSPRTLVARYWPKGQPGPQQLERAIDEVENAIEEAGLSHADRGLLYATESLRHVLPQRFNAPAQFSRDDIEARFSRLVAASSTAGLDAGLAWTGETAAALLLLRELMHHLGFAALSTQP
jgi:hypothetical protein